MELVLILEQRLRLSMGASSTNSDSPLPGLHFCPSLQTVELVLAGLKAVVAPEALRLG